MNYSKNSSSSDRSFVRNDIQNSPMWVLSKNIKHSNIIFIGNFLDRRYVEPLTAYRDVVVVDNDERELYHCLSEIQKTAQQLYGGSKWIGITCDMHDSVVQHYNLWVKLDGIPFGKHWFQLKSVTVEAKTIQLNIKHLRTAELSNERRQFSVDDCVDIDYRKFLTYESVCGVFKFLALFAMSILALTGNALWYISDYGLKMFHEFSGLIEACTPIAIEIIHCITRCVGGLFWLIYVFWRGDAPPPHRMQAFLAANQQHNKYDNRVVAIRR